MLTNLSSHAGSLKRVGIIVATLCAVSISGAQAASISINGLDFDLAQFAGASVTTNVPANEIEGSTFDNPNGIDGFTLGELAAGQFGFDPGDRISLGDTGNQDSLTLTYGGPIGLGAGDASKFVIYEQSGRDFLDPEGTSFEISFNAGAFVNVSTSGAVTATGGVTGLGGTEQNQIVIDLFNAAFGFGVGDALNTVTIRNLGIGGTTDDPDLLFAARAGTLAAVPVPAALPLMAAGLGLFGLLGWRRRKAA
ncbi:MAG: PEP-CTERM sorting domain-containing protein [Alphaproteobacteria bacterium]